ncbi:MAG: glycerophosphodiester phosphodiesterase [Alphaproteobacteria bacterium]
MLKIAHRGASGRYPENTIKAFKAALEYNVDMIELDVHLCRSGEVIVIHDETLTRTIGIEGRIEDFNLDEVKNFCTKEGEHIPTLKETIDFIDKRCAILIEIKRESMALPVYEIVKYYIENEGYKYDQLIIGSFLVSELENLRKFDNDLVLAYICIEPPFLNNKTLDNIKPSYINPHYEHITEGFIKEIHCLRLKSLAWTVNNEEDIERLKKMKIDGIITDYPEKI